MQKDLEKMNIFELILEELESFDPQKPDWLFCLLTWDMEDAEKNLLSEYSAKMLSAAQKCKGLKHTAAKEHLSNLPLSYLIGV